jgi:hypothetical protein
VHNGLIRDLEPFRQARPVWDRAAEMILVAATTGERADIRRAEHHSRLPRVRARLITTNHIRCEDGANAGNGSEINRLGLKGSGAGAVR